MINIDLENEGIEKCVNKMVALELTKIKFKNCGSYIGNEEIKNAYLEFLNTVKNDEVANIYSQYYMNCTKEE